MDKRITPDLLPEMQALVEAVEHARQIQHEPPDVAKALGALQAVFAAHEPLRIALLEPDKPRIRKMYVCRGDDYWVVELTHEVRAALKAAGIEVEEL